MKVMVKSIEMAAPPDHSVSVVMQSVGEVSRSEQAAIFESRAVEVVWQSATKIQVGQPTGLLSYLAVWIEPEAALRRLEEALQAGQQKALGGNEAVAVAALVTGILGLLEEAERAGVRRGGPERGGEAPS